VYIYVCIYMWWGDKNASGPPEKKTPEKKLADLKIKANPKLPGPTGAQLFFSTSRKKDRESQPPLPSVHHERGIQGHGQEEVAGGDHGEREDGDEVGDLPREGDDVEADEDDAGAGDAEEEGTLEASEQARDLLEEGDVLDLLGRGAPGHVDAEEVADDGLGDVQGAAAQEDGEQE
jgi:hypothetical protein